MKLRYTPLQLNVASVEEENSPLRENILNTKSLDGLPVILCPLHSFIAPSAAGIKTVKPQAKVFYVMTDSAALPMAFSHLVQKLKQIGFLDVTISCGQSFGGDLECVNAYTGLLCAKVLEADAVIIASGPGHLGTGTALGFTGVEMGWLIDAVNDLGGKAIFSPRISFFDPRPRHKGISHHTVTVLTQLCHTEATVVFPKLENRQEAALKQQLQRSKISDRHKIVWQDGYDTIELLRRNGIELESMGRHFEDDPAFFLSPAAAGIWAMQNFSNG